MKHRFTCVKLLLIVLLATLGTIAFATGVQFGERPFIDIYKVPDTAFEQGHIRIKLNPDYSALSERLRLANNSESFGIEELDELNQRFGVGGISPLFGSPALENKFTWRHKEWGLHLWYEIKFDSQEDIRDIVMAYRDLKQIVAWAEPEYKKILWGVDDGLNSGAYSTLDRWTPNDPQYANQWHYNNTGQSGGTANKDIDLPEAWEIEKGNPAVVVAVVDEGIQANHPDLAGNIWPGVGYNFVSNSSSIVAGSHGTHTSGTIGAVTNNGVGVSGIAGGSGSGNGVKLMSCQVFTSSSSGGFQNAPIYAADNGAAISQNSWGYSNVNVYDQAVLDAIDYFNVNGGGSVLNGGITIFAAGNDNATGNWYPGCYNGTLSVAATNHNDVRAWYSNYGAWVDVSAPGGDTTNSSNQGVLSTISGSSYAYYQGTSMACPHTSGVAALLISKAYRSGTVLSNTALANLIINTVDNHYSLNSSYTGMLGSGRINARNALLALDSNALYPPSNLEASSGNQVVYLTWSVPVIGNPTGYKIFRNGVLKTTVTGLSYNDTGLSNGTTYSYYLKAVYSNGESEPTPTVTATPDNITSAIIGTGTSITGTTTASPVNIYYKSLHGQAVYTKAELNAAGVFGPIDITQIGFYVNSAPSLALPNFVVRMKHTSATNVASWQTSTGMITVYSAPSYAPTAGGYNMLALAAPFTWDGVNNIVIDTAFGILGSYASTGTVQYSSVTSGYRYGRNDTTNQTNVFTGGSTSTYRPNLKLSFVAGTPTAPEIAVAPSFLSYGSVTVGSTSVKTFTIQNSGTANLTGSITTPTGYSVAQASKADDGNQLTQKESPGRNTLSYTITPGNTNTYNLTFAPTAVASYNGNVTISSNDADEATTTITITGTGAAPANTAPTISLPASFTFPQNGSLTQDFGPYVADAETPDSGLSLTCSGKSNVTVSISGMNVTFGAATNWYGTENLIFTVSDGSLTANDNVNLIVTQVFAPPAIQVAPLSLAYDGVTVGSTSVKQFNIQNTGEQTLTGTITTPTGYTVAISAARSDDLDLRPSLDTRNALSFSVNAGSNKTYDLSFAPTAASSYNGNMVISSNASNSATVNVAVTGTGIAANTAPTIALPASFTFTQGGSLTQDFGPYVADVETPDSGLNLTCSGNSNVTVSISGMSVTFGAAASWYGTENLSFTVSDGALAASGNVNVIVTKAAAAAEAIIGTGTSSNGTTTPCPINVYYKSLHTQSLYKATELTASGVSGPVQITQIGFYVSGIPAVSMPSYVIRMGHTTSTSASAWLAASNLSTVWTSSSYRPTATGWNMITLTTPFTWDGSRNLVIDTAYGLMSSYNKSGTTRYTSVSKCFRYGRSDTANQTNVFSGGSTSNYRPNLKLIFSSQRTFSSDALITKLYQNYPNPFNPETTISFDMSQTGPASLSIYNVKGQRVNTLVDCELPSGRHSYVWNGIDQYGNHVSSGVYLYRLITPGHSEKRQMILMK